MTKRAARGKMDPNRIQERFAQGLSDRPKGSVLWLHALSVGESLALLPLIRLVGIQRPDLSFVLTTTTITSAQALDKVGLPPRCVHQYLPVDTHKAVNQFLDHWRPIAGIFTEMDFWPAIMVAADRRGIPLALINSRFYEGSVQSRGKLKGLYQDLLGLFQICLVQDNGSAMHFGGFGVERSKIQVTGALKGAAVPLACDDAALETLRADIGDRPIWLAAATHAAEHVAMIKAHEVFSQQFPDALMIVAPRNTVDGSEIENIAVECFQHVARRGAGQGPDVKTKVYIADTIGEMGLWYRLAHVSFVGHSLALKTEHLKGKNPFEAAALKSAILHGPRVEDFAETYQKLSNAHAAIEVQTPQSLSNALIAALEPSENNRLTGAAAGVVMAQQQVLEDTWQAIAKMLPDPVDKA
ncbi:MAG: glycosyltransferase N-terminal domain-containing protein [Pseudoruegeria sp.]